MFVGYLYSEEGHKDIIKQLRVNERITAREVRLVGDKGEQLGIMPTAQAQERAREAGLDLVEVAPNEKPPVCRIMDFGKFKFENSKKKQAARDKVDAWIDATPLPPLVAETSVEVLDRHRGAFRLSEPFAPLLSNLAYPTALMVSPAPVRRRLPMGLQAGTFGARLDKHRRRRHVQATAPISWSCFPARWAACRGLPVR